MGRMVGWEKKREREKRDKRSDRVREGRKDDQYYAEIIIIKHKQGFNRFTGPEMSQLD